MISRMILISALLMMSGCGYHLDMPSWTSLSAPAPVAAQPTEAPSYLSCMRRADEQDLQGRQRAQFRTACMKGEM